MPTGTFDDAIWGALADPMGRRHMLGRPKGPFPGEIEQGNIDLSNRPLAYNDDGSISTVRSASTTVDGQEVLMPTVMDNGTVGNIQDAIEQYMRTGKHLGKFRSPDDATQYAQALHEAQDQYYRGRR